MENDNQAKKLQPVTRPEPAADNPVSSAKKEGSEQVKVKKAAKEATQEALDTGESPA